MSNLLKYPNSDVDAQRRYDAFKNVDPFPDIESALLNTADIADYVNFTGMIYPFDPENLKSASYEMDIGGEILYWNEDDEEVSRVTSLGEEIKIRKNSITFVTVNAKFRLPDYIAMRFNLQIEHVHKGILLGTGPLINPGFCGRLMIPLHNLTNNEYVIKCGDPLIGVEFTKLSKNNSWLLPGAKHPQQGKYKKNSGNKSDRSFHDYIQMFIPRGKIVKSSLSGTIDKAERSSQKAEKFVNRIVRISWIALAALIVGVIALTYQVNSIVSDANSYVASSAKNIGDINKQIELIKEDNKKYKDEILELKKKLAEIQPPGKNKQK